MFTKDMPVSLTNIGAGAALELFEDAHRKVLKNIKDINTNPTATRKVTLVIEYKPDKENRKLVRIAIKADSKLAPIKEFGTTLWVAGEGESVDAHEIQDDQLDFDFEKIEEEVTND